MRAYSFISVNFFFFGVIFPATFIVVVTLSCLLPTDSRLLGRHSTLITAMMRPTIVIVHGYAHTPLTFTKFINLLQSCGYETNAPFLPSCTGMRPPNNSFKDDTQLVRRLLQILVDQGKTIIMVLHSYGGIVGCEALQGLDINTRRKQGKSGGIAHLIGIAAHFCATGFKITDIITEMGDEESIPLAFDIKEDGSSFFQHPKLQLFGELPENEQEELLLTLSHANWNVFESKVQFEGWRDVPLTYIHTTKDMTLPAHYQQRIMEKLKNAGVTFDVVTMETGHSAYLTKTEACLEVINNVVSNLV
jgi:pimeloyl-ACP methyl ester carboxylesterase